MNSHDSRVYEVYIRDKFLYANLKRNQFKIYQPTHARYATKYSIICALAEKQKNIRPEKKLKLPLQLVGVRIAARRSNVD
jgi:hypothetical protein